MLKNLNSSNFVSASQHITRISIIMCMFSLSFLSICLSAPKKQVVYVNGSGVQTVGNNNKIYISVPKNFKEINNGEPIPIIIGKFQTVNGNPLTKWRGVKVLNFKPNGTYDFYAKNKLVRSGIFRVGIDPARKGERRIVVLEGGGFGAGILWVRIDSKDRINYQLMNYDRVK